MGTHPTPDTQPLTPDRLREAAKCSTCGDPATGSYYQGSSGVRLKFTGTSEVVRFCEEHRPEWMRRQASERRHLIHRTADYWFQAAVNEQDPLHERFFSLENAVNHLEGALLAAGERADRLSDSLARVTAERDEARMWFISTTGVLRRELNNWMETCCECGGTGVYEGSPCPGCSRTREALSVLFPAGDPAV